MEGGIGIGQIACWLMFDFINMLLFAVFDEQHPLEDSIFFPWCDCIDWIGGFGPEIDLILLIMSQNQLCGDLLRPNNCCFETKTKTLPPHF